MIENAIETERQSQHMQRAITERMDEVIESRAAEMTLEEAETRIESDKEILEPNTVEEEVEVPAEEENAPAEENAEEKPAVSDAGDEEIEWNWSDSVLDGVLEVLEDLGSLDLFKGHLDILGLVLNFFLTSWGD